MLSVLNLEAGLNDFGDTSCSDGAAAYQTGIAASSGGGGGYRS